jgi:hypothetical protein
MALPVGTGALGHDLVLKNKIRLQYVVGGMPIQREQRGIRSAFPPERELTRGRRRRVVEGENSEIPEQDRHRDEREDKASDEHHERVLGIVGALYPFFRFGRAVSYGIGTHHHEVSRSLILKLGARQ